MHESLNKFGMSDVMLSICRSTVMYCSNCGAQNPEKAKYLVNHGFKVCVENLNVCIKPENYNYLYTKKIKMGHNILFEGEKDE